MSRRIATLGLLACLAVMLLGCGASGAGQSGAAAAPAASPGHPVTLTGKGTGGRPVRVGFGLTLFALTHSGQGAFRVDLENAKKQKLTILSGSGPVNGSRAWSAAGGTYTVDVTSDDPWSIDVSQPATTGVQPAASVTGVGPQASKLFVLHAGDATFTFVRSGQGAALAELLDGEGVTVATVVKGADAKTTKTVRIAKTGPYLVNVIGDGRWTMGIAQK